FSVFLFDDAGRTLLQQRAHHKLTWPGIWSNTCCGHPRPGEPLLDAALRRLDHEMGIRDVTLTLALPEFRYRARWRDIWENEICPVFVGHFNGTPSPNPQEVAATAWMDWADFIERS